MEQQLNTFPDFLYPADMADRIKVMKLTEKEQIQLGLEEIYHELPYTYVEKVGAFNVLSLQTLLKCKLISPAIRDFVVKQIEKEPDKLFDPEDLLPAQHLLLCKYITRAGKAVVDKDMIEGKDSWYWYIVETLQKLRYIKSLNPERDILFGHNADAIKNPFMEIRSDYLTYSETIIPDRQKSKFIFISERGRKLLDWCEGII